MEQGQIAKKSFPPTEEATRRSLLKSFRNYKKLYRQSLQHPDEFWSKMAHDFAWHTKWKTVLSYDWKKTFRVTWFDGGKTNICENAVDRHAIANPVKAAFIWVGNEPGQEKIITYAQLHEDVCRIANGLKKIGVKKGDRIAIYMPMIPELPATLLACARIGAIHSVIFGGFSAESIKNRIIDCGAKVIVTADSAVRGKKIIPLKEICDDAMKRCEKEKFKVKTCIVFQRTHAHVYMKPKRDINWEKFLKNVSSDCPIEPMKSEDPLFILYTSGSTGKPKGVLHTTAGYMVYVTKTFQYIFDYHPEDIYWCTADIGWITGHSYVVYGPLCAGATSIIYEGIPNYPNPDRCWDIIDHYKITTFYTAPTAIRSLMKEGNDWPKKYDLRSLKILGSVGEPINPEAWLWYYEEIGQKNCPVVDTWWQTETGGIMISPIPGLWNLKPGSATLPFFGIEPAVFNDQGRECKTNESGSLVIKRPWPGIMRTVYRHHARFKKTYFSQFNSVYTAGDMAKKDRNGYFWMMGRNDDVLKISGHRIGTAEVESALVSYPTVAEAAVVGFPHEVKGEGIYAFVTLKSGQYGSDILKNKLRNQVRKEIGPVATPDKIQFTDALPKTRSGKIMRRILRKIAQGHPEDVGDISTLADPSVVDQLVQKGKHVES